MNTFLDIASISELISYLLSFIHPLDILDDIFSLSLTSSDMYILIQNVYPYIRKAGIRSKRRDQISSVSICGLDRLPRLEDLTLIDFHNFDWIDVLDTRSLSSIRKLSLISTNCRNVDRVEHLEYLSIQCLDMDKDDVDSINRSKIRYLNLNNPSFFYDDEDDADDVEFKISIDSLSNLSISDSEEYMNLTGCTNLNHLYLDNIDYIPMIQCHNSKIKTISIYRCSCSHIDLRSYPSLEYLYVDYHDLSITYEDDKFSIVNPGSRFDNEYISNSQMHKLSEMRKMNIREYRW